ncbi:hypothetical protein [uncultured Subdoligranulum sp.]|uniref:hypothetical protein n=1 Tax=uncultured Subdoligranulum sp. TaxID=512298 RepID=UPI00261F6849|nr:hypothetical protein [uncultured Subdoligranulum sp.]
MIEFINSLTGTRMFVVPEREAEYLAAGHTRVADAPAEPPKAQAPEAKPATKPSRPAAKKPAAKRSTPAKK